MKDEPTRALPTGTGTEQEREPYGNIGPADPHADPATTPALVPDDPTVPTPAGEVVHRTRSGVLWSGLIASAVVLLFLLIFILQNLEVVRLNFLGMTGSLPVGVAMLLAAIAGVLLVALPGGLRMWQLARAAKKADQQLRSVR